MIQMRRDQPSLWHQGLAKDIEHLREPWSYLVGNCVGLGLRRCDPFRRGAPAAGRFAVAHQHAPLNAFTLHGRCRWLLPLSALGASGKSPSHPSGSGQVSRAGRDAAA